MIENFLCKQETAKRPDFLSVSLPFLLLFMQNPVLHFLDPALPIYERSSRRKFDHYLKQISIYIHGKCTALHLRQILCDR